MRFVQIWSIVIIRDRSEQKPITFCSNQGCIARRSMFVKAFEMIVDLMMCLYSTVYQLVTAFQGSMELRC